MTQSIQPIVQPTAPVLTALLRQDQKRLLNKWEIADATLRAVRRQNAVTVRANGRETEKRLVEEIASINRILVAINFQIEHLSSGEDLASVLVMVRDADDDCQKDGLQTIPPLPRAKIDAALAKAGVQ